MKLEEAIKQKVPFKCPYEKGLVNLLYTNSWLRTQMKDHFSLFDVTAKQYNILRILKGADKPVTTSYIRERLLDKLSDVSRIVDRMEKNKLISKKTNVKDKRLVDVKISKLGLDLLASIEKEESVVDSTLRNLSEQEIVKLNALLDKIRIN